MAHKKHKILPRGSFVEKVCQFLNCIKMIFSKLRYNLTYHKSHNFKVYNLVFLGFRVVQPSLVSNSTTFSLPQKETPRLLAITTPTPPLAPTIPVSLEPLALD